MGHEKEALKGDTKRRHENETPKGGIKRKALKGDIKRRH